MHPKCESAPNVNLPRMSECAQCECPQNVRVCPKCQSASNVDVPKMSVCPMQMHPKCQSAPNVDRPKMSECLQCESTHIFWVVISVPIFSECTQGQCANAGAFFGWLFLHPIFQSDPTMSECAQYECIQMSECARCECAQNVRVCPM